jgi:6-phosphogluconate dehydrogenase (decarboxylating)
LPPGGRWARKKQCLEVGQRSQPAHCRLIEEQTIDIDVISHSLFVRFLSRQEESFSEKMLAAFRHAFGGHAVRRGA